MSLWGNGLTSLLPGVFDKNTALEYAVHPPWHAFRLQRKRTGFRDLGLNVILKIEDASELGFRV